MDFKMNLNLNNEIIGQLISVDKEKSFYRLRFSMIVEIDISKNSIPLDILKIFIGKKIGLFNNDGNYKIRIIREK